MQATSDRSVENPHWISQTILFARRQLFFFLQLSLEEGI
jgi:hypothetical protein